MNNSVSGVAYARGLLVLPLMAAALTIGGAASAQTAPATPPAEPAAAPAADPTTPLPPTTGPRGAGDEIVVTAQKRQERLIDVPIAITAVSGARLEESGVKRSYDLAQNVPGLRIDEDGGNVQPTVRGIGNQIAGPGVSPAVATYIDGFYQTGLQSLTFDFVGIDSVQVLKGPQGTLFGRNATGGAIVITTKNPSQTPDMEGSLSYGRFNEVRAQVYANAPINDTLAFNIAATYRRSDGFTKNILTGADAGKLERWSIRGKVRWEPTPNFSAQLQVEHTNDNDGSSNAYGSYQGLNNVANLLHLDPNTVIAPSKRGETANDYKNRFYGDDSKIYLTLQNKFDNFATLTSYTQYQKEDYVYQIDFDATNIPVYGAHQPTPIKTISQELNLTSNTSGRLQWVAGAYYFWSDAVNAPYYQQGLIIDPTGTLVTNAFYTEVETRSYAAFADATYKIGDKLFLTGGIRYSHEKSNAIAQQNPDGLPAGAFGGPAAPGPRLTASQQFHSFTPRAVARYEFSRDANVYASYSKGFKGGGFAPTNFAEPGVIPQFKPEKVDAYEIGFKGSSHGMHLELAAYYNNYKDQQVAFYTGGVGHINNAASAKIYGGEAQFNARLNEYFSAGANAAYAHANYKDFTAASRATLLADVPFDASGLQMSRVPRWTGNIYGTYTHPIGDGKLIATASFYMTSKVPLDPTDFYVQKGYHILNGRITYALPGDHIKVSVFGDNITNTKYTASILPFPPFAILQQYGAPVTCGVEVAFKF